MSALSNSEGMRRHYGEALWRAVPRARGVTGMRRHYGERVRESHRDTREVR